MRRLADAAELCPSDWVLEVGGGTGGLTDLLARRAGRVFCVEIDRDLLGILETRFCDAAHVKLIGGDVLAGKHHLSDEVQSALASIDPAATPNAKLVANLPYQVATPLLMNLLTDYPVVRSFVFTVQAEVGERITAEPNCKAYGPLSIVTQTLCSIHTIARIPPQAFWPAPSVHSLMMRMDVGAPPFASNSKTREFASFVRGVFEHRRKVFRTALSYVVGESARSRILELVDGSRRSESIPVADWLTLFRAARC